MKWIETENRAWVNSDHIECISITITGMEPAVKVYAVSTSETGYTIATYNTEAEAKDCVDRIIRALQDGKTYTIRATVE
jgi:hypothetical protein